MTGTRPDIYIKQLEIFLSKSDTERFQVCEDLMIFGRSIIESAIIQEELNRITDSMKQYLQKVISALNT